MIARAEFAQLTPAKRAQVIYATAQAEMTSRLWRAALGDGNDGDKRPAGLADPAQTGSSDALFQLLTAANQATDPNFAQAVPQPQQSAIESATDAPHGDNAGASAGEDGGAGSPAPCALGVNARYGASFAEAERRTGIPAPALAAIVNAEAAKNGDGSWNPLSRNTRSSAAGLGQFLSGTWAGMAETPGTALHQIASARGWLGEHGKVRHECKAALLALRYDGDTAIHAVADYAKGNLDRLEKSGIAVRDNVNTIARAAYLTHHLGLGDAKRFLQGGLVAERARTLLHAQIGTAQAEQRIAQAGNPTSAHRQWLLAFIDRNVRPDRFVS